MALGHFCYLFSFDWFRKKLTRWYQETKIIYSAVSTRGCSCILLNPEPTTVNKPIAATAARLPTEMTNETIIEKKTIKCGERWEKLYWNTLNELINSTVRWCWIKNLAFQNSVGSICNLFSLSQWRATSIPRGSPQLWNPLFRFNLTFQTFSETSWSKQSIYWFYQDKSAVILGPSIARPEFTVVWWHSELSVAILHIGLSKVVYFTILFITKAPNTPTVRTSISLWGLHTQRT